MCARDPRQSIEASKLAGRKSVGALVYLNITNRKRNEGNNRDKRERKEQIREAQRGFQARRKAERLKLAAALADDLNAMQEPLAAAQADVVEWACGRFNDLLASDGLVIELEAATYEVRYTMDEESEKFVEEILVCLNRERVRCTYEAVAGVIGGVARGVGRLLGEPRPEVSWVVLKCDGRPSGYTDSQMHPELMKGRIIYRVDELRSLLKRGSSQ